MAQRAFSTRRVARIVAAIGTILALMLAGGAPSEHVTDSVHSVHFGR